MTQFSSYELWKTNFKNTNRYNQLKEDFDNLHFHKEWNALDHYSKITYPSTPRQDFARHGIFSVIPFYYIDWLAQSNPREIYDLGCGWNVFKKYYPNIVGVDPDNSHADIHCGVNSSYVREHEEYFESVFSINALHFIPLSSIRKRVENFASMIKPGGRGWLAMNAMRMLERDTESFKDKDKTFIQQYIEDQVTSLSSIQSLDIDLSILDEYLDGNIQIIFTKKL